MVNSHEDKTKNTSRRSGGSSRATSTTRKSHRSSSTRKSDGAGSKGGGSRSPNRSGEPRRSKRSKEDLEAKEKARAARDTSNIASELAAVDHTDGAVLIEPSVVEEGSRNKPHKSNRRSQQDKGVATDAKAKVRDLLDRSNEANTGPAPGAHADSRGDEVAKDQKSGKGRFSRPLGTQSVFPMEERARMEAEKSQDQDGLVMANAVDESQDEGLAMDLLNSMLDRQQMDDTISDRQSKETKKARASNNKTTSDSREESKEEQNEQASDENKDWESSKLKKGVLVFRFLCCIIVLGAAGIGTWIALRDNNNNSMSETMDKPPNMPDEEPISSVNPSPIETSSVPSGAPNSNTGADVITFDPPSDEDCAAVANGDAIQGQDTMPIQSYLLDLDATPFLPMDLSISAGIIEDKLRELLTTALTGCDRDVRKLRHRHRNLAKGFSYAIGNVMVDAVGVEGVSCRDALNPNCHRVSATLDIVVKDVSVKVATVITELSQFFGGGALLVNNLELAELYESVDVANLGSIDPSQMPSTRPTNAPVVASPFPSETPTEVPSASPTSVPSRTPSLHPSTNPTSPPTRVSTPAPTPFRAGKVRAILVDHAPWNDEAFRWLTETDTWEPDTTNDDGDPSNSDYLWLERYVMADFYFTTNGANWWRNDNWLSTLPVCNWELLLSATNECPGAIKKMYLNMNQLTSSIPSSIGSLTQLASLGLYMNQLTSSIPSSIGSLAQLTYLGLHHNQLTSSIPSSIGSLLQLEELWLVNNKLSGSIPVLPSSIVDPFCRLGNNCFQDTSNGQSAGCDVTPNCS